MIKTSIFYFLAGTLIGFFMFLGYNFENFSFFFKLREVHAHLLFLGFVIQMIMGVGLWMFPRKTPQEPEERVKLYRKEEKQGLSLYFLFNSGTVLRSIFEGFIQNKNFYYLALSGVILLVLSIFYFFLLILPRIRKPGK